MVEVTGILALLATPEPPELGPGPRPGVMGLVEVNKGVAAALAPTHCDPNAAELLRALVLLWHDHLEAAHLIAQHIETPDGSFVHGIVHRREPDYSNAKYWFRRVGTHPSFPDIRRRASGLLAATDGVGLASKLTPRDEWDAFAFVDVCERAAGIAASDSHIRLLRELQRMETEALLVHLAQTP